MFLTRLRISASRDWQRFRRRLRGGAQRGVAILMVVLVLVALTAISVPFAVSMNLHAREAVARMSQAKAKLVAEGSIVHGIAWLYRTNNQIEADPKRSYGSPWDTPRFDTIDEIKASWHFSAEGAVRGLERLGVEFNNPRGQIWHVNIEDEQGKINVLSASPVLLGNLLASSSLAEKIDPLATTLPLLEDPGLPHDDDPRTLDGWVMIGNEPAPYYHVAGSALSVRRVEVSDRKPWSHRAGTVVYDARGYAIAELASAGEVRAVQDIRKLGRGGFGGRLSSLGKVPLVLRPEEYERLERDLTVQSFRWSNAGWFRREPLLNRGTIRPSHTLMLRRAEAFGPGTRVRFVTLTGQVKGYGRVRSLRRRGRGGRWPERYYVSFENDHPFDGDAEQFAVEAELRHPINVNTARKNVLEAVFQGISLRTGARRAVTSQQAQALAAYLINEGGALQGLEDFKAALVAFNQDPNYGARYEDLKLNEDQRRALEANAGEPNSMKLKFSTTTFCYSTYGAFTLEGSGVVNTRAGTQRARHTARQAVSVPSALLGVVELRSQGEFTERAAASRLIVTAPNALIDPKYSPDEDVNPHVGGVRLAPSRSADPASKNGLIDHFDREGFRGYKLTVEGAGLGSGGSLRYATARAFALRDVSPGYQRMAPGFFEMWVKPKDWRGRRYYFFDVGDRNNRNRLSFYYDRQVQSLVLEVWDGNLYGYSARLEFPTRLDDHTWYHVAAAFKGSDAHQLGIRVDDRILGDPIEPGRYRPSAVLAAGLDTGPAVVLPAGILVDEPGDLKEFPEQGAVIIGGEVFEYTKKTDSGFDQVRRGARWSAIQPHETGAMIRPFGYVNPLNGPGNRRHGPNQLYVCRATVASDLPARQPRTRIEKLPSGIDETETKIPVQSTDGFQGKGVLRIENEFIYYGKKTATAFEQCVRGYIIDGQAGAAVPHKNNQRVRLYSIHITDGTGYPRPPRGRDKWMPLVSFQRKDEEPEWIQYGRLQIHEHENGKQVFLMPRVERNPLYPRGFQVQPSPDNMRGRYGSPRKAHAGPGEVKVLPVVHLNQPYCGDKNSPRGEEVSVLQRDGDGERAKIARSAARQWRIYNRQGVFIGWGEEFLISLRDFVKADYDRGNAGRIHQFPSGELPLKMRNVFRVGADRHGGGPVTARIDEVKFVKELAPAGRLVLEDPLTLLPGDAQSCQIQRRGQGNLPSNGVIRIGNEFIYYAGAKNEKLDVLRGPQPVYAQKRDDTRSIQVVTLSNLERGILGTNSAAHGHGAPVMVFDALPVALLATTALAQQDRIALNDARNFDPEGGYVRINNEVVSYTYRAGNILEGAKDFRGRFGTPVGSHAPGTVVQGVPYRFHDRYAPESDSGDLSYFQFAHSAPGAFWRSIEWETRDVVGRAPSSALHVRTLVRFDGKPAWDQKPTNRLDGLWEFTGTGGGGAGAFPRGGLRADMVEVRMFFAYNRGSYRYSRGSLGSATDDWKRNAEIDRVRLEFTKPLVVKRHDIIDR